MVNDQASNISTTLETNKINLALSRLEKVILDSIDFEQVVQKIVDSVFYELNYLRLGYRIVVLALIDEKKNVLQRISISRTSKAEIGIAALPYSFDQLEIPLSATQNYSIRAINEKKTFITHYWPDFLTPPLSEKEAIEVQMKAGIKTSMIYPLVVHDKSIGIMIFSMIKSEDEILPEEKELLLRFTDIVGLAVQNSKLYSSLQETTEDLKQANEKLKQLDMLKDEFVSLASHELRTPMTAIKSYLWLVLQQHADLGTLTEKQKLYLDRTYQSTERLIRLVNDMLNVSRIESGRMTINLKPIDMIKLVNDVVAEVLPNAQNQQISLSIIPPSSAIPDVSADPEKIKEVLINLIGNSLKFTPSGGKITISFAQQDTMVVTSVTDTGKGIKQEDMPKLFQKFDMIEGNYVAVSTNQGTGLGLYITKNIVEMHGGKVTVASEGENKGTTFSFSLKTATTS